MVARRFDLMNDMPVCLRKTIGEAFSRVQPDHQRQGVRVAPRTMYVVAVNSCYSVEDRTRMSTPPERLPAPRIL
jgi:hypothetical protein